MDNYDYNDPEYQKYLEKFHSLGSEIGKILRTTLADDEDQMGCVILGFLQSRGYLKDLYEMDR